jgi:Transposase
MLEVKVERCAGIDVHKKFVVVCVMIGLADQKPASEVLRFGTSVPELKRLKTWLLEKGCTDVVMESTGSYWKPVFNILEGSVKVILANPEQVKALRGKKTDPNDSRWAGGIASTRISAAQFHSTSRHPRTAGSNSKTSDTDAGRSLGTESSTKDSGRRQRQNRQCTDGYFWHVRASHVGSVAGEQADAGTNGGSGAGSLTSEDFADYGGFARSFHEGPSPAVVAADFETFGVH